MDEKKIGPSLDFIRGYRDEIKDRNDETASARRVKMLSADYTRGMMAAIAIKTLRDVSNAGAHGYGRTGEIINAINLAGAAGVLKTSKTLGYEYGRAANAATSLAEPWNYSRSDRTSMIFGGLSARDELNRYVRSVLASSD